MNVHYLTDTGKFEYDLLVEQHGEGKIPFSKKVSLYVKDQRALRKSKGDRMYKQVSNLKKESDHNSSWDDEQDEWNKKGDAHTDRLLNMLSSQYDDDDDDDSLNMEEQKNGPEGNSTMEEQKNGFESDSTIDEEGDDDEDFELPQPEVPSIMKAMEVKLPTFKNPREEDENRNEAGEMTTEAKKKWVDLMKAKKFEDLFAADEIEYHEGDLRFQYTAVSFIDTLIFKNVNCNGHRDGFILKIFGSFITHEEALEYIRQITENSPPLTDIYIIPLYEWVFLESMDAAKSADPSFKYETSKAKSMFKDYIKDMEAKVEEMGDRIESSSNFDATPISTEEFPTHRPRKDRPKSTMKFWKEAQDKVKETNLKDQQIRKLIDDTKSGKTKSIDFDYNEIQNTVSENGGILPEDLVIKLTEDKTHTLKHPYPESCCFSIVNFIAARKLTNRSEPHYNRDGVLLKVRGVFSNAVDAENQAKYISTKDLVLDTDVIPSFRYTPVIDNQIQETRFTDPTGNEILDGAVDQRNSLTLPKSDQIQRSMKLNVPHIMHSTDTTNLINRNINQIGDGRQSQ